MTKISIRVGYKDTTYDLMESLITHLKQFGIIATIGDHLTDDTSVLFILDHDKGMSEETLSKFLHAGRGS